MDFFTCLHNDIDVDECEEGLHPCTQDCVNILGSFMCACSEGFALDQDGITCKGNCNADLRTCAWKKHHNFFLLTDIDECEDENGDCEH